MLLPDVNLESLFKPLLALFRSGYSGATCGYRLATGAICSYWAAFVIVGNLQPWFLRHADSLRRPRSSSRGVDFKLHHYRAKRNALHNRSAAKCLKTNALMRRLKFR
jgi:hypothetical protein